MSEEIRFIVTKELGRLAKWLRIIGFDAAYVQCQRKSELIIKSLQEKRIILTRNTDFTSRRGIRLIRLKSDCYEEQLREVFLSLKIGLQKDRFFSRCVLCNCLLEKQIKEKIKEKIPEYVYNTQEEFMRCPVCWRVYWKGTHWGNADKVLSRII